MTKLINAFKRVPSPANRDKLQRYLDKHPMAVCLATDWERHFLKMHDFKH